MVVKLVTSVHWNTAEVTHGQQVNAANTGIAGAGLVLGDLTSHPGGQFNTNGATVEGLLLDQSDTIWVRGDGITVRNCAIVIDGAQNYVGIRVDGDNCLIENVLILPGNGDGLTSYYIGVWVNGGADCTIRAVDASYCENGVTIGADRAILELSYLHDMIALNPPPPTAHVDFVEFFGGTGCVVRKNRIGDTTDEVTGTINVSPFGTSSQSGLLIDDNFIDGSNAHVLVDNQGSGTIQGTKVRRNVMGGHTNPSVFGRYMAFYDVDSRGTVGTQAAQDSNPNAVLWPTTGDDVNTWGECSDLSPDRTGQTVSP